MKYWEECLSSSFEEHGIIASKEQIEAIASDIQISHENYGLAFHVPENPLINELRKVKEELKKEKEKVICEKCKGRGLITSNYGTFTSNSQCSKCRGEGKCLQD